MKLLRFLTAITMTLSMVGCCCGRNIVSDGCNPCGGGCGTGLRMPSFRHGFGGNSACGCDTCGTGWNEFAGDGGCSSCGSPMNSTYAMPGTGGSGCNCGSTAAPSSSNYPPVGAPSSPTPLPGADANSTTAPAPPIPPATPSDIPPAAMIPPSAPTTQMVSYEEFQKLPGTVISGPGVTSGNMPAPRLFNRPANGSAIPMTSAQAPSPVWVQAK